jgi:uncharacterized protein with von Willebrand factor type A (vWA) domain
VSFPAIERTTLALGAAGALTLADLYWLMRVSMVRDRGQLATFDAVFATVFESDLGRSSEWRGSQHRSSPDEVLLGLRRAQPNAPSTTGGVPWTTLPSVGDSDGGGDDDDMDAREDHAVIPELRPSAAADELDRPFDSLDHDELERVGLLLEGALHEWPDRRSRRRRLTRAHGGPIAMRRSLRDSLDTGGEVLTLVHTRPRRRPRSVVVVVDVSGSMESYARAYLHLIRPLAIKHRAEVFAIATELSRITPAVRLRSPTDAVDSVTAAVGDRFSGTRLASSLHQLLHHRTWSTMVRGAVVVVFSDGWDADDPVRLERVMQRLGRLAHRVVWVNPRAGADGFEPSTAGMAAALPHCDRFLAGHNARSMRDVIGAIIAA